MATAAISQVVSVRLCLNHEETYALVLTLTAHLALLDSDTKMAKDCRAILSVLPSPKELSATQ